MIPRWQGAVLEMKQGERAVLTCTRPTGNLFVDVFFFFFKLKNGVQSTYCLCSSSLSFGVLEVLSIRNQM